MDFDACAATKTPPQKLAHVAEECSELLKAFCKYQRFGMWPTMKGIAYDNFQDIDTELNDLKLAIARWEHYLSTTSSAQRLIDFGGTTNHDE